MKRFGCVITAGLALGLAAAGDVRFDVEAVETIQKTFVFAAAGGKLKIDNLDGSITVAAHGKREVELVIRRTLSAESKEKLETARQEVRLDLSQKGNEVVATVDAPWRCRDGVNYRGPRFYGYRAGHDFDVKVPADTDLWVRTINRGEISIRGVDGGYDVENINGGVEMTDVSGSGRVYALNGKVRVLFSRNPKAESSFGSLNGNVDVYFRAGLAADLRFKTFNGGVYTDFPVSYLPPREPTREQRDGKFIYRSDRFSGVRVGQGGPELRFDAFNGNIHVRERAQ